MAIESSFPVEHTNIDLRGSQLQANKENWAPVLAKFEKALKQVSEEGNDASLRRHQGRGQLLLLKVNRTMEIAFENDLPLLSLVQSDPTWKAVVCRSKVVFGSSTNQAQAFLGGPPLVKLAIGEVIGAEELGGAKVHAKVTGLADQIALDEFDAIHKARQWVASLQARTPSVFGWIEPITLRYPIEDVLSIMNPDIRKPLDMREVLLRVVDDSRLSVFKPMYGPNMVTASAHIMGFPVGIVANQISGINPNEAAKAAQFIRMCNQQ
ncbi:hypothetical protein N7540_004426 [Penicillium herquei]|nr:hypothetical protein N7540_004426 [Penicillium herquei]